MPIEHLELDRMAGPSSSVDRKPRRRLDEVSKEIVRAKKVIVVSGAGISCSSGIPDFRSENGLYSLVKKRYPDTFVTGKDLFSSGLFQNPATTSVFLTFIAELALVCQKAQPTRTHNFIQKLDRTGRLLRSYTQNVDGFERRMGMESGGRGKGLSKMGTKNVELHGDLGRVRCVLCQTDYPAKPEWVEDFREGAMPDCPACEERCKQRVNRGSRALAIGTLRPAIVLYDEPHPLGDAIGELQGYDLKRGPEILLIMGTSLKVHGLKQLVKSFAKNMHAAGKKKRGLVVFVNATKPGKEWDGIIDVHVQGESDKWVELVEEEWRRIKVEDWEVQTTLDGPVVAGGGYAEQGTAGKPAGKGKGRGRGKASPGKENRPILTAGQLPTPRPSLSPSKPDVPDFFDNRDEPASPSIKPKDDSYFVLSPPASPVSGGPPLSPSKRRANVHTPLIPPSPAKKSRAPQTGLAATPGQGNLFAAKAGPTANVLNNDFDLEAEIEKDGEWEDEVSCTGSGASSRKTGRGIKGARATIAKSASSQTHRKAGAADKENTPVKPIAARVRSRVTVKKLAENTLAPRVGKRIDGRLAR